MNAQGVAEAGIDHGGLMKELLEATVAAGCQPEYGLFAAAEGSNLMYPNPAAEAIPQGLALLEFLGEPQQCLGIDNCLLFFAKKQLWPIIHRCLKPVLHLHTTQTMATYCLWFCCPLTGVCWCACCCLVVLRACRADGGQGAV
jgi:hypothetical protein